VKDLRTAAQNSIRDVDPFILTTWTESFDPKELERSGWTPDLLLEALQKNEVHFVMTGAGALAAAIIYHHVDIGTDEILFLATTPALRGQGLMYQLLRDFSAQKGGVHIWLECREDNVAAIELYKKIGFKESGRRQGYYKDGTTAILFNF
jgi:ribosomal protein S18 acetylase RimI-like enzyme